MANILTAYSNNDGPAHYFNISNETGVEVAADVVATYGGADTYKYTASVPALPAGYYTYSLHRDSNDALRAQGEFYWDGTDIVHPAAAILAAQTAIQADIAALENLAVADVVTALGNYGAATATNVTSARDAVLNAVNALEDLSAAQVTSIVQTEFAAYDGTTQADLDAAQTAIESLINSTAGLTVAQSAILTFIRDVLEADEVYTNTTAQKLLKGTTTVLVDKTVATATPCTINTSITEA